MIRNIEIYFLLFIIYSFIGWTLETVRCGLITKKWVNRGFLIGPYCPIYGISCVCMYLLLEIYINDILVVFVFASIICSIIEYMTSYIMEKMYKTRWWDYSHMKFNINGRICLQNAVIFGLLSLLILYIVNPFFVNVLNMLPEIWLQFISLSLAMIVATDFVTTLFVMKIIKKLSFEAKKDNTEEVTERVKQILTNSSNILVRRITNAFPNLKSTLKSKRQELKEQLEDIIHADVPNFVKVIRDRKIKSDDNFENVTEETINDLKEEIILEKESR